MGLMIFTAVLPSCQKQSVYVPDNAKFEKNIMAMDTYMTLTAYGKNAEQGLDQAAESIHRIEEIFSVTDSQSEIYRVNHRTENTVKVSEQCLQVLQEALEVSERSEGAFDISIYPILKAWGFTTGEYRVPSGVEIENLQKKAGFEKINIDVKTETITLEDGMEIDFGGIAKGYAGDEAVNAVKEIGVESAIFSLGGNIQTLGSKPDGSAWVVAVKDPENPENFIGTVKVRDQAVVTSGGYERYFEENGKKYSHIINPDTGYPAESTLLSVTIIGEKGILCDALSTALYVKGLEGASEYWKTYGGFEAVFVTENREIYITEGLKHNFEPKDAEQAGHIYYIEQSSEMQEIQK